MKKYFQLLVMIFLPLCLSYSQSTTFQKVTAASYLEFKDVFFINESTGWVVGNLGSIYKSTDGGQNWQKQQSNINSHLKVAFFLDEQKGFAIGDSCKFLSTTDGGSTWKVDKISAIPSISASIYSVYFADNLKGWILASSSSAGWILSTTDGGVNWTINLTVTGKSMNKMKFFEPNKGIACGKDAATIYYTSDGINWTLAPTPLLGGFNYSRSDLRNIYMTSATEAYIVGWGTLVGAQPTIYLKTTDGGATWVYLTQSESNRTYDNLYNLWFKDANNGIATGGATLGSLVARTTDGGQNWIPIKAPFGSVLYGITGFGNKVWISGGGGLLAYSSDFGETWQLLTPMPSGTIYSIEFPTSLVGYAAGFDGVLHKTTDGGETWRGGYLSAGNKTINIQSIFFVNENVGYAACSYQMVAKTTDGGTTWSEIIPASTSAKTTSYSAYFINVDLGFVVGKLDDGLDIIYKTTDGGSTWTNKMDVTGKNLRDVAFKDENNGIIVGLEFTARFTTDGGTNWSIPTFINLPTGFDTKTANVYSVRFISENEAIAVGNKFILKSSDSGASWSYIQTSSANQLNSVSSGSNLVYAVGVKEAWQSTDAGNTWTNIFDTTLFEGTLNSSTVDPNGNAWFGAGSSSIYTNRTWVGVEHEGHPIPNGYELKQNYPNPFNPTTVIDYKLGNSSFVTLDVFDVLGKRVARLVDAYQPGGNYSVKFNPEKLSGAVYFYRLKVDGKVSSKKMILIK